MPYSPPPTYLYRRPIQIFPSFSSPPVHTTVYKQPIIYTNRSPDLEVGTAVVTEETTIEESKSRPLTAIEVAARVSIAVLVVGTLGTLIAMIPRCHTEGPFIDRFTREEYYENVCHYWTPWKKAGDI
jgi:hypothetical protein